MNINELKEMATRYFQQAYREDMSGLAEARVVTGIAKNDLFFHRMLVDHGIELVLKEEETGNRHRWWKLEDYRVVDEQKYMMFCLRWS